METLKDIVSKEIMTAMKAKDKPRLNALRYLKKLFIENDTAASPKSEQDIVIAHAKKIHDSIDMYPAGSEQRAELETEHHILCEFLPKQLTEAEVVALIDTIIAGLEKPQMGLVMKELSPQIKGKFDGKLATQLIQQKLG